MKFRKLLPLLTFFGIVSFSLTASCSSDEDNDANPQYSQKTVAQAQHIPQHEGERVSGIAVVEKVLCPDPRDLTKVGMFWGAPNGWRSFSQSFIKEIYAFVEAQWHGVNVGKMMCVYVGKSSRNFPVVLQNDILVEMPTTKSWGTLDNGIVKCKDNDIENCPFYHTKREVDMDKVYNELDFKKGKSE